jgi:hypothetical protein
MARRVPTPPAVREPTRGRPPAEPDSEAPEPGGPLLGVLDDEQPPDLPNPTVFGVDLVDAMVGAAGAAGAGYLNDKILAPVSQGIVGGVTNANNTIGQLVDAFTTILSAWVIGRVVGTVDRRAGRVAELGGGMLGGGKAIAAFVPGFSLSARFPEIPGFPTLGAPPAAAAVAAPTQSSQATQPLAVF